MYIRRKMTLASLAAMVFVASACANFNPLGGESVTRLSNWTDATHSNQVAPNYDKVFAENKVHRIDIKIQSKDWALMQENMKELFGEGGQGGPGGFNGGGNGERPMPPDFELPEGFPEDWQPGDPIPEGLEDPFRRPENGEFPGPPGEGGPGGPGGGGPLESEENPIYRPATITYEGNTWEHVGVRYKGNSSLRSSWGNTEKLPLRFDFDEFEDDYPEIDNQRFYGFKRLTLSSNWSDDTLIREKIAPDLFRKAGVPAARTAFYRVYIDHGEGSQYFGLYTMVEVPDAPMFQTQFLKDGGNLYKPSGRGAQFGSFNAEHFFKKTNEKQADFRDIEAIFRALHADRDDAATWRKNLEAVFDVEGFLKYLAVNNVIQNWDTYGSMAHNYYLYTDPGDNLVHWIPWDHNMSMGGGPGGGGGRPGGRPGGFPGDPPQATENGQTPNNTPTSENVPPQANERRGGPGGGAVSLSMAEVNDSWPLIRFLMDDPVYLERYKAHVKMAAETAFAPAETEALMRQAHTLIRPYVVGAEGERPEATLLSSSDAFDTGIETLVQHVQSQHEAVQTFLVGE